ncbi:putative odorant receptor 85e [Scaptodrosophila lebanonensis]|uniref:Odorant receptor n=1 Tax=Drosophila lebanonensis TaxID=7225 RepID=A0A6J2TGD4_DROLE|nr:putative odorant receptor 85e [Scaptodrosophila lebanonensis]
MASTHFHGGDSNNSYGRQDAPRVKELFPLPLTMQLLSGQIPAPLHRWLPAGLQPLGWFVARSYCLLVIFSSLHLGLLFSKSTLDALPTGQLEDITDALTMAVIYFFTAYATTYWFVRSQQLLVYVQNIQSEYRHHSLAGVSFVSAYGAYRWARNFSVIWVSACLSGVTFWAITPLVVGSHTLPLSCWYPFDALAPGNYASIYVTQLYAQIMVGSTFSSNGALFVSLCVLLLAQYDVLYCSLKNLDAHASLLAGESLSGLRKLQLELLASPAASELQQYVFLEEHMTNLEVFASMQRLGVGEPAINMKTGLHMALVECVQLHRFIVDSCAELERLFNPYCLVKSLQITIQLCLLVFVGVSGTRDVLRIINQLQYLVLTLLELFMFTFCGELLRRHSVRAGDALWRSNWWHHAHLIKTDVLILLINSRRAVQVTAGKFYVMDVNRLRLVVTQAFSFLTLLQKLAAKKTLET